MKIFIIHGQNHKGSSYTIGRMLADLLANESTSSDCMTTEKNCVTEFFLPRDLNHCCTGCCSCLQDEKKCPFHLEKQVLQSAMEESDVLIFTTPAYCIDCSGAMKNFIDLFFQNWMVHRPKVAFFKKKAVVISTVASTGVKRAIETLKKMLEFWGVPFIKTFAFRVYASSWNEVSNKRKQKVALRIEKMAKVLQKRKVGKPSLFIRFIFWMMKKEKAKSVAGNYDFYEAEYWRKNGWLDKKRPWLQ